MRVESTNTLKNMRVGVCNDDVYLRGASRMKLNKITFLATHFSLSYPFGVIESVV